MMMNNSPVSVIKRLTIKVIDFSVKLWKLIKESFFNVKDFFYRRFTEIPKVASVDDTIDTIIRERCSVARFGDGEIKLVAGKNISFQDNSDFIKHKMREVLSSDIDGLMIGIADIFDDSERYDDVTREYWKKHLSQYRAVWYRYLITGKKYYNASMTRQYIGLRNKEESGDIFEHLKKIWDGRDVVIIEGEFSRLGVGNDLLDNARSIERILGPSRQAFSKYDEILAEAKKLEHNKLILLALGPAATCLVYDLHKLGYQAVDIGHIDVEYEWYKMKAEHKMPIKNKMVHEAVGNNIADISDVKYEQQIIAKIL